MICCKCGQNQGTIKFIGSAGNVIYICRRCYDENTKNARNDFIITRA
jgi:protein-arginine kinase activator protein McsA